MSILGQHKYIVPDVIEPVVGYRGWIVIGDTLRSTTYRDTEWSPGGSLKAECHCSNTKIVNKKRCRLADSPHHSPHKGGHCGFYAFKRPNWYTIKSQISGFYFVVLGEVELWGKIIEHDKGYRSQYARVRNVIKMAYNDGISENNVFDMISSRYNTYD